MLKLEKKYINYNIIIINIIIININIYIYINIYLDIIPLKFLKLFN